MTPAYPLCPAYFTNTSNSRRSISRFRLSRSCGEYMGVTFLTVIVRSPRTAVLISLSYLTCACIKYLPLKTVWIKETASSRIGRWPLDGVTSGHFVQKSIGAPLVVSRSLLRGSVVKNLVELQHDLFNVGGLEAAPLHRRDHIAPADPLAPGLGEQGRQFWIVVHRAFPFFIKI